MRRLASLVILAACLSFGFSGVFGGSTTTGKTVIDRTLVCKTETVPAQAPFLVYASPRELRGGVMLPAGASVQAGQSALVAFTVGYQLGVLPGFCQPSQASVPLTPHGLLGPERHGLISNCYLPGRILVRARVLETNGRVRSGALAVRMLKTGKPVFYATVNGPSASAYETIACIPSRIP